MRYINKIIIHCSDSGFGDAATIDAWHKARGWRMVGYHMIILNGIIKHGQPYDPDNDGLVQPGRPIYDVGAHCRGQNGDSIGICLIGKHHFSAEQLYNALPRLLKVLMKNYGIGHANIFGHRDFSEFKTCPNIDTQLIRRIAKWT